MECGWDDIGSWESIWNLSKKDNNGNALSGRIIAHNTRKSLIKSGERLVVTVGLENAIIIDTKDALLVANRKIRKM